MKKIIAAKTAPDVTQVVSNPTGNYYSFAQTGLAGSEVIDFQINLDGTWTSVIPPIQLTATNNFIQLSGPAAYRVNKPTTASPVAVFSDN